MFDAGLAAAQLIGLYRKAYVTLLERIAAKQLKGSSTAFERALIRDVGRVLDELDGATRVWAEQVIPTVYSQGQRAAFQPWLDAGLRAPAVSASFAKLHEAAVQVIAANMVESLSDATSYVGRAVRDEWRKASLEAIAQELTTGETGKQAKRNLQNTLAEEGLSAFKDRAGHVWRLDDYAQMVIRTTTAETTNTGTMNQLRSMGYDLVRMTEHRGSCSMCAPYQGRVYSVSGRTPGYPALSEVPGFAGGYQTLHPNCRHRVGPYVPELDPDRDWVQEFSNSPFADTRSESDRRAYERMQEQNSLRRQRARLEETYAHMADGPEKDAMREKLRAVRGKQQSLGRETTAWVDSVTGR